MYSLASHIAVVGERVSRYSPRTAAPATMASRYGGASSLAGLPVRIAHGMATRNPAARSIAEMVMPPLIRSRKPAPSTITGTSHAQCDKFLSLMATPTKMVDRMSGARPHCRAGRDQTQRITSPRPHRRIRVVTGRQARDLDGVSPFGETNHRPGP